jgi:F-type H+-transporting ATPase subunit epsilon
VAEPLHVELVAADHTVWSGEASIVIARTTEGELGVLPGHEPTLGLLDAGTVTIRTPEGEHLVAAVDAGFFSVADDRVSILSDHAEMSDQIDVERARADLERAESGGGDEDEEDRARAARAAQARLAAAEKAS